MYKQPRDKLVCHHPVDGTGRCSGAKNCGRKIHTFVNVWMLWPVKSLISPVLTVPALGSGNTGEIRLFQGWSAASLLRGELSQTRSQACGGTHAKKTACLESRGVFLLIILEKKEKKFQWAVEKSPHLAPKLAGWQNCFEASQCLFKKAEH